MDEPSTGLDPASRNMLWNVVKQAKQNRAIILTSNYSAPLLTNYWILYFRTFASHSLIFETSISSHLQSEWCMPFNISAHSMEEAEHLCDRLGIFVDGSLQCVGNPKEVFKPSHITHCMWLISFTSPTHHSFILSSNYSSKLDTEDHTYSQWQQPPSTSKKLRT